MIEDVTVWFSNGKHVDADRVKFKDGGWLALNAGDGWVYYPPRSIGRVVSRSE